MCNPELARLLLEFEDAMSCNVPEDSLKSEKHHKDNQNFRKNFVSDAKVLCKGFSMNPFLEEKLKRVNNS